MHIILNIPFRCTYLTSEEFYRVLGRITLAKNKIPQK
nr:MAG TPA: hypothetical protein [Caudoviricetes sp.]